MKQWMKGFAICGLCVSLFLGACSQQEDSIVIDGTTQLTSDSLEGASVSSKVSARVSAATVSNGDLLVTPTNVSGEALMLLYGFGEGQGLDVFGPQRPDLAQPGTDLVDFDFADELSIASTVYLKDDFPGGSSDILVIGFGYMDIAFTLEGENLSTDNQVIRVAMGSVGADDISGDMTRGDVLMKVDGVFKWYDLDNSTFTTTRPSNPVVIENIRDFEDSSTPDRHFFSFNVGLTDGGITVDADELKASAGILNVVNFSMGSLVTIDSVTDADTLTDATLIQKFSLESIISNNGVSDGLSATSTLTVL